MTTAQKRLPLWPALILIIVILIIFILNPLCRYLYTKDFVARTDVQLAELFAGDVEKAGITDLTKPIFFFGSSTTRTNGVCLDLSSGKYNIFSAFAVKDALKLDTLESSQYIVNYLNDQGYAYTAPTKEDWTACQAAVEAHIPLPKSFPWYDSIIETEAYIFVQLSDSQFDIAMREQLGTTEE